MPLPWVRLDTSMPDNPKILRLLTAKDGHRAAFVWCCSLAYAGKHGTDGLIEEYVLGRINGRPADAARLVEYGLWTPVPGVGWQIHGWADMQESTTETQARSRKAQAAANTRWEKERRERLRSVPTDAHRNAPSMPEAMP